VAKAEVHTNKVEAVVEVVDQVVVLVELLGLQNLM
jgi:hypothetical protein